MKGTRADLKKLCARLGEAPWAERIRAAAFERMKGLPAPTFSYGSGVHVRPDFDLEKEDLVPKKEGVQMKIDVPEPAEVSSGSVLAVGREEAAALFDSVSSSKMSAFNDAFSNSTLFITIPKGSKLERPAVVEIAAEDLPQITSIFIIAKQGSKAKILLKKRSAEDAKGYFGLNVKVLAEKSSELSVINIQGFGKQVILFEERSAKALEGARVDWFDLSFGAAYANSNVTTALVGREAETNVKSLFAANHAQKMDLYTAAVHRAQDTKSDLLTRGVINEEAKALSRGLIVMEEGASGSEGFEKQDSLLLCDRSEADAIPNLEIRNHDVKCSHGSTVGQIDSEKLFYLLSKGIPFPEAKKLIISGYFNPLLEELEGEGRRDVEKALEEAIAEV